MKRHELEKRFGDCSDVPMAKEYTVAHKGFQQKVLMSNTDITFFGGSAGGGKTISEILSALYGVDEENFTAVLLRNTLKDVKSQGGLFQLSKAFYPNDLGIWTQTDPAQFTANSGAIIEYNHLQNQDKMTIERIWKGRQLSLIIIDEISPGIMFSTFQFLLGRNRHPGKCSLKPRIMASCNPSSEHWIRTFIDWYVGADGKIDPEKDGMVRYFYITDNHVDSVVWGNSKREVYEQCKQTIDAQILAVTGGKKANVSYENFIKSFTFIEGKVSENTTMLKDSGADYIGSLANQGRANASALLEGNWNAPSGETYELISPIDLQKVFYNEPQISSKRCITVDMALKGGDMFVVMVWYGFHLMEIEAYSKIESDFAIAVIRRLKEKHGISERMIVYDDDGLGSFMTGAFKHAIEFHTNGKVQNEENYKNIKSQCADKWADRIKKGGYSFSHDAAHRKFKGKGSKDLQTLEEWLLQERRAFRWKTLDFDGKLALIQKKEMKPIIGRSPDFTESWIMREMLELIQPYTIHNERRLLYW